MTIDSTSDLVARHLGAVGGVAILSLGMLPAATPAPQPRLRRPAAVARRSVRIR